MILPKLAICNFMGESRGLKAFALDHGFSGIDWSFDLESLPLTPRAETQWAEAVSVLEPLELRYHCPFYRMDLGHEDAREAKKAEALFQRIVRLVAKVGGRFLSIHIGLGHDTTEPLCWQATIDSLARLVRYGATRGVIVCLENLAWGWTSKPHLYEKLIRGSGAGVTFDVGHAHACESIRSQYYTFEDFVSPHTDRVRNAHVYHTEVSGLGHVPPQRLGDLVDRLRLLREIGCPWWVLEVHYEDGLLQTKRIVDEFLAESTAHDERRAPETLTDFGSQG